MSTRRGKEYDFFGLWMKDGTDYGNVREVPTARKVVTDRQKGQSKRLAILLHGGNWSSGHPLPSDHLHKVSSDI